MRLKGLTEIPPSLAIFALIDLQNFILLVRTVPFLRKIIFISSYTEKNNYFLLYELIQDLPYLLGCKLEDSILEIQYLNGLMCKSDQKVSMTRKCHCRPTHGTVRKRHRALTAT